MSQPKKKSAKKTRASASSQKPLSMTPSRSAAQQYEVVNAWVQNGEVHMRVQNMDKGNYIVLKEIPTS